MTRRIVSLGILAAGCLATVQFAGATGASAAPNSQDQSFATGNEQTNLAEITIGNIALQRGSSSAVRDLATKTIADHKSAMSKLQAAAKSTGITLPSAPNAQQQAQAATLKSVAASQFDATYLQIQLAGHQLSIANTNTELSAGSDSTITGYARGYLPVAQMHLSMTQQDLAALGLPTSAPAGTGGLAATGNRSELIEAGLLAAGAAVLLAASAGLVVRGRRSAV